MDLRSVLNTSENADRAPVKTQTQAPPTPQQQQQQPPPQTRLTQSPAQYTYRDYPPQPPPHPSPGKPLTHDYPQASPRQQHQPHPNNSFPPQSPYQAPGPYPGRPAPPPLQPTNSYHDGRSPRMGSVPGPSPYRQNTNSSIASAGSAGYPFPPSQPPSDMTSPVQRHQYPPQYQQQAQQQAQLQRQDSFPQGVPPHGAGPYVQQPPVPQTPPVGTPGGSSYGYVHQRSQSVHSTPTPTSAQSQHQFGPPYAQGSPVASGHPQSVEYPRQPSQPPTPLGPPLSAPRQAHGPGSFAQPPSPYQQRTSSTPGAQIAQPQSSHPSPHHPQQPPPIIHRVSGSHPVYESPSRDLHRRSSSNHDREHSLSVSPKTRVPSLPSNPDRTPSLQEGNARAGSVVHSMAMDIDRAVTPAKRKLEDRDLSPRELEHKESRPPPAEAVNGGHTTPPFQSRPAVVRKNRVPRTEVPVWAQDARTLRNKMPKNVNFVLQKRVAHVNGKKDSIGKADGLGKTDSVGKPERVSRHTSPETTRSQPTTNKPAPPPVEPGPPDILGPWEPSITGVKPYEEVSRLVADFLFINVVNNEEIKEIMSRGIQFEIEAKLGRLIDKDTNQRVERFLASEGALRDTGRTAFKSTMTEAHHKSFNDFLNQVVIQTDPRNPNGGSRVQVHYKHRREIDRFFEIPPALQERLPGCVRARIGPRKNVKVRVTYDQKTGDVLGKIVKARVADFDIHLASCPMDCRISVNLEMDWDGTVEELEAIAGGVEKHHDRNKDRLSYKQGHYQIDLTQVTQTTQGPGNSQRVEKEHELEIELAPGIVIDQGQRAMSGGPHRYQELVEGLIDNVRVLARKAAEFE